MPSLRWVRRLSSASALALMSLACSDKSPVEPEPSVEVTLAELITSDPFLDPYSPALAAQDDSTRRSIVSAAGGEIAFVSLPAGSLPKAISVTIRNLTTGAAQTPPIAILDGGFDPIPVVARAGDDLEIRITGTAGSFTVYRTVVPKRRPPAVVRTRPAPGAIDIAVNSQIMVVFTEPVAPATLTATTVQLLRGATPVPGTVRLVAGSLLAAEFVPDAELASGTTYRLVVTRGVRDAGGDSLEVEVATDFTTLTTTVSNARLVFSSMGVAPNHKCGLEAVTGLAYCWGDTHSGALGIGVSGNDDGSAYDFPALVWGARSFSSMTVSSYDTCGIEALTALAYCWGNNNNGQLGDGTFDTGWIPTLVGAGSIRFSSISAGVVVTCGIEAQSGFGYCWGKGGLIGDGTLSQRSNPTLVGSGSVRFSSISASESHVCGIEAQTGLAYCWGLNGGELGDGTTTDRLVPTLVVGRRKFTSIDAEYHLTCGIEAETDLAYCWGKNSFGQVGDGTTTDRPVPTLVESGSVRFSSINAGGEAACAVETQTSVGYCWGHNNLGQLGDGTTTDRLVPTMVGGGTPRFSSISATSWYQGGVEAQTGFGYWWGGGFENTVTCSICAHPVPTLVPPPRGQR